MSLAMYAAPFEDNLNNDSDYIVNKKRQHNKTQKRLPKDSYDTDKVNNVLDKIHENVEVDGDNLGDFNPPPKPDSAGFQRTAITEQMHNMSDESNKNSLRLAGSVPQPINEHNEKLDMHNFNANYGDSKTVEEYYKKMLPGYKNPINKNPINKQYYNNTGQMHTQGEPSDVLLNKLNYMISLLEEKQDEKTNNVTEEVILYSFLGIFIIFVVDSFSKAGKYIR